MGSIGGSIRPYLALLAASTPQRDKNRARLTKFLRFDPAQCELLINNPNLNRELLVNYRNHRDTDITFMGLGSVGVKISEGALSLSLLFLSTKCGTWG